MALVLGCGDDGVGGVVGTGTGAACFCFCCCCCSRHSRLASSPALSTCLIGITHHRQLEPVSITRDGAFPVVPEI